MLSVSMMYNFWLCVIRGLKTSEDHPKLDRLEAALSALGKHDDASAYCYFLFCLSFKFKTIIEEMRISYSEYDVSMLHFNLNAAQNTTILGLVRSLLAICTPSLTTI